MGLLSIASTSDSMKVRTGLFEALSCMPAVMMLFDDVFV